MGWAAMAPHANRANSLSGCVVLCNITLHAHLVWMPMYSVAYLNQALSFTGFLLLRHPGCGGSRHEQQQWKGAAGAMACARVQPLVLRGICLPRVAGMDGNKEGSSVSAQHSPTQGPTSPAAGRTAQHRQGLCC